MSSIGMRFTNNTVHWVAALLEGEGRVMKARHVATPGRRMCYMRWLRCSGSTAIKESRKIGANMK
jgi:hypothetical protein